MRRNPVRRRDPLTAFGRGPAATLGQRRVHLHWANLFGVVSFACLLVLAATGVVLMFTYVPSGDLVTYDGPHEPLAGARVSKAFDSTMEISFEQAGGMLIRQTHHWAGLVLPAAMILQLLALFFTGGFRRPRRAGWVLLTLAFLTVLVAGWSGYALPDDMLSGTGLRIVEGVMLGIPVVGTWLASWTFGGRFPGEVVENLYPVHVVVTPALIAVLLLARARLAYVRGSARPAAAARSPHATLGMRLWPDAALRAAGLSAITAAVLVLLGATSTISPIGSYGPTAAGDVGAGSQPDWYMGFLDGALRLVPAGWEAEWFGWTWTFAVLVPLLVVGGYFLLVVVHPFVADWVTGDTVEHHVLDRPRNVPARTGLGVAGMVFYGVLWAAGGADILATAFGLTVESVITVLQVALVTGPPLSFEATRRICVGLRRRDREIARHGYATGRIVRLASGEYVEVRRPVPGPELARLEVPGGAPATRGEALRSRDPRPQRPARTSPDS